MSVPFQFACPIDHSELVRVDQEMLVCPVHREVFRRKEGIWRFLPLELKNQYDRFMQDYEMVRSAEGRGTGEPAYYRALPYKDLSGRFQGDWKIRARSFQALLAKVVIPLEKKAGRALRILDLGAGNGWLSYRLALRDHQVAAVDLQTNPVDGLGAYPCFDREFLPVQADYNHLPFLEHQIDLLIFNASFHYSTSYSASLEEAQRVLLPEGQTVILDTPVYNDAGSGVEMVRQREDQFQKAFGFASNALPSENYLTYQRLNELEQSCGLRWQLISPFYGLIWTLRPFRERLAGHREPARFRIILGTRATVA